MTLEALRVKIGTGKFLKLMRTWATGNRYGSANIESFIALAEVISADTAGVSARMKPPVRILFVSGSLRDASTNSARGRSAQS